MIKVKWWACGDEANDLSMIGGQVLGVAMQNAVPESKQLQTMSIWCGEAVAWAVEKYVLKEN